MPTKSILVLEIVYSTNPKSKNYFVFVKFRTRPSRIERTGYRKTVKSVKTAHYLKCLTPQVHAEQNYADLL